MKKKLIFSIMFTFAYLQTFSLYSVVSVSFSDLEKIFKTVQDGASFVNGFFSPPNKDHEYAQMATETISWGTHSYRILKVNSKNSAKIKTQSLAAMLASCMSIAIKLYVNRKKSAAENILFSAKDLAEAANALRMYISANKIARSNRSKSKNLSNKEKTILLVLLSTNRLLELYQHYNKAQNKLAYKQEVLALFTCLSFAIYEFALINGIEMEEV